MKSKLFICLLLILFFTSGCELLIKLDKEIGLDDFYTKIPEVLSPANKIYTAPPTFTHNATASIIFDIELNGQSINIENNTILSMSRSGFNKLTIFYYLNGKIKQRNIEYFLNSYSLFNDDDFDREDDSDPTLPENNWLSEYDTVYNLINITNNQLVCNQTSLDNTYSYITDDFSFTDYEENLFSVQINSFEKPYLSYNKIIIGPTETLGILKKSSNGLYRLELQNENFILIEESENDFSLDLTNPNYLYYYNNMDNNDYILFLTDNESNILQKIHITRDHNYTSNQIRLGFYQTNPGNTSGIIIELDDFEYRTGPLIQK